MSMRDRECPPSPYDSPMRFWREWLATGPQSRKWVCPLCHQVSLRLSIASTHAWHTWLVNCAISVTVVCFDKHELILPILSQHRMDNDGISGVSILPDVFNSWSAVRRQDHDMNWWCISVVLVRYQQWSPQWSMIMLHDCQRCHYHDSDMTMTRRGWQWQCHDHDLNWFMM